MNFVKTTIFFTSISLSGCHKAAQGTLKSSTLLSETVTLQNVITAPKATGIKMEKKDTGLELTIEYDLHCAPGLSIISGDQSSASIHGMPLSKKEAIDLSERAAGTIGSAYRKRTYDADKKLPAYVILPSESAVVFDPRRLKVGTDLSDTTASFRQCATFKNANADTMGVLPFRVMANEEGQTLKALNKGVLNLRIKDYPETSIIGQINFKSPANQAPIKPLFFKSTMTEMAKSQFPAAIFDRLRQENADAGISASAFGMRWDIAHLGVTTTWNTCGKLGTKPIKEGWTQDKMAHLMTQKSITRRLKTPVAIACPKEDVQIISRIQNKELSKLIWETMQVQHEQKSCDEDAFLSRHTQNVDLNNWLSHHAVCGLDSVKSAMKKTRESPTALLKKSILAGELKLAAKAMRNLRPYIEYKDIPELSRSMVSAAIKSAAVQPENAFSILAYGFRGVAFGKRSLKPSNQKKMLSQLGDAVDRGIAQAIKGDATAGLKAHKDFGGILGKNWRQQSRRKIQLQLSQELSKKEAKVATAIIKRCQKSHPSICSTDWAENIISKINAQ